MRLAEALAQLPGVDKRLIYYLEAQGHIRPRKVQKARIARRDYSEADVRFIRHVWRYYSRGVAVQRAVELATHQHPEAVYAFCRVPARREREALDLLRGFDQVVEGAVVYGETVNLVAQIRAADDADVYAVLDRLFEAGAIVGAPRSLRTRAAPVEGDRSCARPAGAHEGSHQEGEGRTMLAWVLIRVPAKRIGGLVDRLRAFPGIVEAAAVYGETDVIAKIEVPDQRALDQLIIERIQAVPEVESTRTFIAVGGLHWARGQEGP